MYYVSDTLTLYNYCICGCSSCIYQEKQLLDAAQEGRVDEVATLLYQTDIIQCCDEVSNERMKSSGIRP